MVELNQPRLKHTKAPLYRCTTTSSFGLSSGAAHRLCALTCHTHTSCGASDSASTSDQKRTRGTSPTLRPGLGLVSYNCLGLCWSVVCTCCLYTGPLFLIFIVALFLNMIVRARWSDGQQYQKRTFKTYIYVRCIPFPCRAICVDGTVQIRYDVRDNKSIDFNCYSQNHMVCKLRSMAAVAVVGSSISTQDSDSKFSTTSGSATNSQSATSSQHRHTSTDERAAR